MFSVKMVSIEVWRSAIGSYNTVKLNRLNRIKQTQNIANAASLAVSTLLATVLPEDLIGTLLRIGCIEANPGPRHDHEGNYKHNITIDILCKNG